VPFAHPPVLPLVLPELLVEPPVEPLLEPLLEDVDPLELLVEPLLLVLEELLLVSMPLEPPLLVMPLDPPLLEPPLLLPPVSVVLVPEPVPASTAPPHAVPTAVRRIERRRREASRLSMSRRKQVSCPEQQPRSRELCRHMCRRTRATLSQRRASASRSAHP